MRPKVCLDSSLYPAANASGRRNIANMVVLAQIFPSFQTVFNSGTSEPKQPFWGQYCWGERAFLVSKRPLISGTEMHHVAAMWLLSTGCSFEESYVVFTLLLAVKYPTSGWDSPSRRGLSCWARLWWRGCPGQAADSRRPAVVRLGFAHGQFWPCS